LHELATLTGDFLVRELATPLGKVAAEERSRRADSPTPGRASAATSQPGLVCQTFGAYWFAVPRRLLLQRVTRRLCRRLVQGWRAENAEEREAKIQAWVVEQLSQCQLTSKELAATIFEQSAQILDQPPDQEIGAALGVYCHGQARDLGGNPRLAAEAIAAVEQLVGSPGGEGTPALQETLDQAVTALASHLEGRLAELALRVLAEPHFRLLGVEDLVQERLSGALAEEARTQKNKAENLSQEAAGLYPQIGAALEALGRGSFWGWGKKNRAAAEFLNLLGRYAMLRLQVLTRQTLSALHQDFQANLQNYRRKVDCCRSRIGRFLREFEDAAAEKEKVDLGLGQYLLPAGCRTLTEAVEQILGCLTAEELDEIDARVQALIGRAFEAQVHVCTAPANFFKNLEEEVLREVAAIAEAPLGRAHAAEMYLAQRGQDAAAVAELGGAFHEAAPELAGAHLDPENELNILAVPPGPEGEYFRSLVQEALPDRTLVPASNTDDIVFYREVLNASPATLPQMGQAAAEVYRQFLAGDPLTPHSRTDIANWLPSQRTV
jgi:hypothetical protein